MVVSPINIFLEVSQYQKYMISSVILAIRMSAGKHGWRIHTNVTNTNTKAHTNTNTNSHKNTNTKTNTNTHTNSFAKLRVWLDENIVDG